MRPSRYLVVLAVIFIALGAMVFFGGEGSLSERLKPKLGLDLIGGTTVTFTAQTEDGKDPSASSLEEARQIMEDRVNGLGVAEPEVVTEGNKHIVINVAGQSDDAIKLVGTPAELRFRKVLNMTPDTGVQDESPSPSASATPAPSGSAT